MNPTYLFQTTKAFIDRENTTQGARQLLNMCLLLLVSFPYLQQPPHMQKNVISFGTPKNLTKNPPQIDHGHHGDHQVNHNIWIARFEKCDPVPLSSTGSHLGGKV